MRPSDNPPGAFSFGDEIVPTAPKKPCRHPRCPELTDGSYCSTHAVEAKRQSRKQYDDQRDSASERGYDRAWQRFRLWFLRRHPLCEASQHAAGCRQVAEEVHHIQRLEEGGERLSESNCQALSKSCHSSLRGAGGRV